MFGQYCSADEDWDLANNIFSRNDGFQGPLHDLVGVAATGDRDQDVLLSCESTHCRLWRQTRMARPCYANITFHPEPLSTNAFGHRWKRTHGKIEFARFEPWFEVRCFGLQYAKSHVGSLGQQQFDQWWQKLQQASIDHAEIESSMRGTWRERNALAAQQGHAVKHGPDRSLKLTSSRCGLHATSNPHEQRIIEVSAQLRERFAERRLRDVELGCSACEAVLAQQHVQYPQLLQTWFCTMMTRNSAHIVLYIGHLRRLR